MEYEHIYEQYVQELRQIRFLESQLEIKKAHLKILIRELDENLFITIKSELQDCFTKFKKSHSDELNMTLWYSQDSWRAYYHCTDCSATYENCTDENEKLFKVQCVKNYNVFQQKKHPTVQVAIETFHKTALNNICNYKLSKFHGNVDF